MLFKKRYRPRRSVDFDEVLQDFDLPSFPGIVTEILSRLSDPEVSMNSVGELIELDPGLSVRLLRLANSAATGLRRPLVSIQQAATMLGRNQIESILISSAARDSIPEPKADVFDSARFWRAAACRAVIATSIGAIVEPRHRSETFTAGLLQDMALPVLVDHVDGYAEVLHRWYAGDIGDLAAAEYDQFGWDHADIAAQMCRRWEFPPSLANPISLHHSGDQEHGLVGVHLVSGWHELDDDANRLMVLERIAHRQDLAHVDREELVDEALSRVGEVSALFA